MELVNLTETVLINEHEQCGDECNLGHDKIVGNDLDSGERSRSCSTRYESK